MTQDLSAPVEFRGYPVQLNHAPLAYERPVSMPGIMRAPECDKRPGRRHFGNHVIEIIRRSKQSQSTVGTFPTRIHVDQRGDDFFLRVCVDLTIFDDALAAYCYHGRPAGQIDLEFFLECPPELMGFELVEQLLEPGTMRV